MAILVLVLETPSPLTKDLCKLQFAMVDSNTLLLETAWVLESELFPLATSHHPPIHYTQTHTNTHTHPHTNTLTHTSAHPDSNPQTCTPYPFPNYPQPFNGQVHTASESLSSTCPFLQPLTLKHISPSFCLFWVFCP